MYHKTRWSFTAGRQLCIFPPSQELSLAIVEAELSSRGYELNQQWNPIQNLKATQNL
jgi:hypothetical protein